MRTWYRANLGGLPGAYWYLWAGTLINRLGGFAVLFLSLYLTSARGLSPAAAGLVVGAHGVGGALGVLAGGVLADRWGRRSTLLACHAAATVLMLALAFSPWLPVITVVTALIGFAQQMAPPAFVAAIVDVVPEPDRTRAFNLQFWAVNLGMAGASLLAGMVAEVSFTLLFTLDATATFITFVILLLRVPETGAARESGTAPNEPRGGLHTALTDRTFLTFVGLTFVLAVLTLQTSTILPLAMRADGLRPSAYGLVTAFAGVLIVLGQLFVPRLITGRVKGRVLAVAVALLGLGIGMVGGADTLPVYLVAAAVWTAGSMLAAPPNAEINAELSPPELRGRYQSVFYLTFPAAGFVAPAVGGWSLEHLGNWHWALCGLVGVLAAVGHLLASPARERRVAATIATPPRVSAASGRR
ncbi:MFS transporter [Planosporangium thailandense]|uniref:MFS transporter n=1 Tax=Planosporangium thailandense TaxID=765197 RepID=A0ABX0XTH5_9ACTN|nr:MFS transporter [Planosporangium thailandense]NJC69306.1 MFS transporter [Planosporangium thailandense]